MTEFIVQTINGFTRPFSIMSLVARREMSMMATRTMPKRDRLMDTNRHRF